MIITLNGFFNIFYIIIFAIIASIRQLTKFQIWARNQGPHNPPDELVFDREESFGVGHNVHTVLYNTKGEVRVNFT